MDFCDTCQGLFRLIIPTWKSCWYAEHYKSPQELAESALDCKLCLHFLRAIVLWEHENAATRKGESRVQRHPHLDATDLIQEFVRHLGDVQWGAVHVYVGGNNWAMTFQSLSPAHIVNRSETCPPNITHISISIDAEPDDARPLSYRSLFASLSLYAHHDSLAAVSGDIAGRPPLPAPDAAEASGLIKGWIEGCMKYHPDCRVLTDRSVINEPLEPSLPTRVLHLRGKAGNIQPQLLRTSSLRGRYTALSHRWGQAQPLTTTKGTLAQRLLDIPWGDLPQTFRDAMVVTKSIGLDYIWIDSLCIVQDDHGDWLAEAERMGDIYENAHLTIMATHAQDGTEGMFGNRPEVYPPLEIPYFNTSGDVHGSIFLGLTHNAEEIDESRRGLLTSRGWVTQELILSRRAVSYTPKRLIWVCKTLQAAEDGGITTTPYDHQASIWTTLMTYHTAREVTHEKDRLISLQGIVNKLRNATGDEYHWGLWQSGIREQLLWYRDKRADENESLVDAPSWSWACDLGSISFPGIGITREDDLNIQFADIKIVGKVLTVWNCQLKVLSSIEKFEDVTSGYPWWPRTKTSFDKKRPAAGEPVICAKIVGSAFLFLEPVLDGGDAFRRIGYGHVCSTTKDRWFDDAIRKTIHIV